jgi:hypothetical protein
MTTLFILLDLSDRGSFQSYTIHKDNGLVCKRLRRSDTIDIDTVSPYPMKQKHLPIKVLGPSSKTAMKIFKKIHTTRGNAKRKRVMVDRELVGKYKVWCYKSQAVN